MEPTANARGAGAPARASRHGPKVLVSTRQLQVELDGRQLEDPRRYNGRRTCETFSNKGRGDIVEQHEFVGTQRGCGRRAACTAKASVAVIRDLLIRMD